MANRVQPPPNPNRYITDNDDDGNSFFSTALPESLPMMRDLGGAQFRLAYTTDRPPIHLPTDTSIYQAALQDLPGLVPADGGANVWYVDTPPDSESPMHRTVSVDFVIQVAGELELTLASGEKRTIRPGDITVQRSTLHKWRNTSKTQWSRMVAVMAQCQPVVTRNAGALGPDFPKH